MPMAGIAERSSAAAINTIVRIVGIRIRNASAVTPGAFLRQFLLFRSRATGAAFAACSASATRSAGTARPPVPPAPPPPPVPPPPPPPVATASATAATARLVAVQAFRRNTKPEPLGLLRKRFFDSDRSADRALLFLSRMQLRDSARRRGQEAAHVERIDRHIRLVAGVNRGRQFGLALARQRETRRKEHNHFSPRNSAQILGQTAHG